MTNHTPGPWRIERPLMVVATNEANFNFAITQHIGPSNIKPEQLANAKLIAKAPEMLELLTQLLSYFKDDTSDWLHRDPLQEIYQLLREIED